MQTTSTKPINCFTGYEFVYSDEDNKFHNMYRGTDVGKGGYIFSNPGIHTNVALLDIQSMHPASLIAMNCFGEYTQHFQDLRDARVAIKKGDFETARTMLGGKLAPYLDDESRAKDLAQALKISINSVYGLTAANFNNPMRDIRNKNNIVALRGSLFMRTLQDEVESRGFTIVAIRTDSIKIANATDDIIKFCMEFADKYNYIFEHEATYERMCQINDADYVARYSFDEKINGKHAGEWTATGARFQHPYVFKRLFTKEPIVFEDLCEAKEVKSAIYLDLNENLPDVSEYAKELDKLKKTLAVAGESFDTNPRYKELTELIAQGHSYTFVGKVGNFCSVKPGCGGGELVRTAKTTDGSLKYDSVSGTKGYRWLEAETIKANNAEDIIDTRYYDSLVNEAYDAIASYGDAEWFIADDREVEPVDQTKLDHPIDVDLPWFAACGKETCYGCPNLNVDEYHFDCTLGYDISDFVAAQFPQDEEEFDAFTKR